MTPHGQILFVVGMPRSSRPWQQQCVWYRVVGPGQALRAKSIRVEFALLEESARLAASFKQHEIERVVLHRGCEGPAFDVLRELTLRYKAALWYDLDDNIIDPGAIPNAVHLTRLPAATIRQIQAWTESNIRCLKQCDGAIFATEALRDCGGKHNPNSHLASNFIPDFYMSGQPLRQRRPGQEIRIYYGPGSVEHLAYFEPVARAFSSVLKRFPNVRLFLGGGVPTPACLRRFESRVSTIPRLSPKMYFRCLQSMDIALAPLPVDPFSVTKSWIKVLEAAANGCAWMASEHPDYRKFHELTGTGQLIRPGEWYAGIADALANLPDLRELAAARAAQIRQRFSMSARVDEYLRTTDLRDMAQSAF